MFHYQGNFYYIVSDGVQDNTKLALHFSLGCEICLQGGILLCHYTHMEHALQHC